MTDRILLDLFSGDLGWASEFARRGWKVYAVDIKEPTRAVHDVHFIKADVLTLGAWTLGCSLWTVTGELFLNCFPDFIVASSPCEEFSVFGMRHFHPNPPYPEVGIKLFNHTRLLCERSGVPYVMENVRAAQQFVGKARNNAGSFYLWGNGVPTASKMPNCRKGFKHTEMFAHDRTNRTRKSAIIPPELANCVADYAERILERAIAES